jgi:thioredoxin-like negative regulator of GroEL
MIAFVVAAVLLTHPPPAASGQRIGVRWERSFDEALARARTTGKPVMVDFWADWCGWCHRLDRTTYVDPIVVGKSQGFVPVKVDTEGRHRDVEIAEKYDVATLPTIAFLSPSGRLVLRVTGFQGPGQFPRAMDDAKAMAQKVMSWEAALQKNAHDGEALAALASHMFEQESYEESRDLLVKAVAVDQASSPDQRKRTRMLLAIIYNYRRKYAEAEAALKDGLEIRPTTESDAKLLYVLGKTYLTWGRSAEARDALERVVQGFPDSSVSHKARESLLRMSREP